MARIKDGLTKTQRATCMAIFNSCKNGTWENRQVSYEAKAYFDSWVKARDLTQALSRKQLSKFTFGL